jgi:hypothetical protein
MTMSLTADATQATQVEQARAVAEVAAAVHAAAARPRDEDLAIARFKRSCARIEFAQRAFYKYPRGGKNVTDVTIRFAIEAARCWGNMTSGSAEIERQPGQSTVVAFAWDLETNFTRRTTFVSPHSGYTDTPEVDANGQARPARALIAVRDVRENNQSAGSRVERQQIIAALPSWFVEMGKAWCAETVANQGKGKPIEDRRRQMVEAFEGIGVRREELIRKIGAPVDSWVELDLATLTVLGQSIRNGETDIEAEFGRRKQQASGPASVSTAELAGATADGATVPDEPAVSTGKPSQRVLSAIAARLTELGFEGRQGEQRERRIRICSLVSGENIGSMSELTPEGAEHVRRYLSTATANDLAQILVEDQAGTQPADDEPPAEPPAEQ